MGINAQIRSAHTCMLGERERERERDRQTETERHKDRNGRADGRTDGLGRVPKKEIFCMLHLPYRN